jgi:hypothetical protein
MHIMQARRMAPSRILERESPGRTLSQKQGWPTKLQLHVCRAHAARRRLRVGVESPGPARFGHAVFD